MIFHDPHDPAPDKEECQVPRHPLLSPSAPAAFPHAHSTETLAGAANACSAASPPTFAAYRASAFGKETASIGLGLYLSLHFSHTIAELCREMPSYPIEPYIVYEPAPPSRIP